MNAASYKARVTVILREYENNPEGGHVDEDRLLAKFVRAQAENGSPEATELLRLLDSDVRKWFA